MSKVSYRHVNKLRRGLDTRKIDGKEYVALIHSTGGKDEARKFADKLRNGDPHWFRGKRYNIRIVKKKKGYVFYGREKR
jgi:hypothetical protein